MNTLSLECVKSKKKTDGAAVHVCCGGTMVGPQAYALFTYPKGSELSGLQQNVFSIECVLYRMCSL